MTLVAEGCLEVTLNLRLVASEADTAQAAAFLAILARHLADVSLAVDSADRAVEDAKSSKSKALRRRTVVASEDIHAERDELRRQIHAILRRFPSLSAQHDTTIVVANS